MYKFNLRLKTMVPVLIDPNNDEQEIEIKVVAEDGINITDEKVVFEDIISDVYGVSNIYPFNNKLVLEVMKDPYEDYSYDEPYLPEESPYEDYDTDIYVPQYTGPVLIKTNKEVHIDNYNLTKTNNNGAIAVVQYTLGKGKKLNTIQLELKELPEEMTEEQLKELLKNKVAEHERNI